MPLFLRHSLSGCNPGYFLKSLGEGDTPPPRCIQKGLPQEVDAGFVSFPRNLEPRGQWRAGQGDLGEEEYNDLLHWWEDLSYSPLGPEGLLPPSPGKERKPESLAPSSRVMSQQGPAQA